MGRKPLGKKTTVINKKTYNYKYKQICLKGQTLDMFEYDQKDREITESNLGSMIIKEYYRTNPPLGFFTEKKH